MCCKDEGPATGGTGVCEFGVRAAYEFPRAVSVAGASGVSAPGGSGGLQTPAPGEEVVCVFPNHLEGREWGE